MTFQDLPKPLLLDYAPAPSLAWWLVRKAIRFILLGGLVAAGYIWGPVARNQFRMLYWQRQCMNFTTGQDELVYDGEAVSGRIPAPSPSWVEFVDAAAQVGPALSGLPQYGSLVFLGQLKTPSGEPRLVAVAFTSQLNWWAHGRLQPGMSYQTWVLTPGSTFRPPMSVSQDAATNLTLDQPLPPPNPRFYFGRRDPADPSHFTVRYRAWGQDDTVDGRIDDAGQVTLRQRRVPTRISDTGF